MRNLRTSLSILTFAILTAVVLFPSCKPKKLLTQEQPAPVQAAPVQEVPRAAAVAETDTDNDGISDAKDNCPNKAGTVANNGCPEVVEPTFNYKNIQFEFNSSVLKTSSYPILDEIAREIKKYPSMQFNLNGHSSEEGTDIRNMTLSVDRANAVKSYLVSSSIDGNTLVAKGFGESVPLQSNETEGGRELNRRVEIQKL